MRHDAMQRKVGMTDASICKMIYANVDYVQHEGLSIIDIFTQYRTASYDVAMSRLSLTKDNRKQWILI